MRRTRQLWWMCGWVLAMVWLQSATVATAQVRVAGNPAPAVVQAGGDYFTMSVSAMSLNFNLVPQGVSSSAGFTVHTTWSIRSNKYKNLAVFAFFDTTAALSTSLGDVIPANTVNMRVTPSDGPMFSGAFGAVNVAYTGYPAGFVIRQEIPPVDLVGKSSGDVSDSVSMSIDLSSVPQLPTGTYTGTMHVRAQLY